MPPLDPTADRPFWPRNPYPEHPRPQSQFVSESPEVRQVLDTGGDGAPTRWTPFGIFISHPYPGGGHGDRNDLNQVARADFHNSATGPWPRSGVWDEPNVWPAVIGFLRLPPSTSAHPGASLTSGEASPTMLFHTPPVWGMQTTPIYAVGV